MKKYAKGALICAFFGSVWMYWAALFGPIAKPISFAAVTLLTIAICGWAIARGREVRHYQDSAADQRHWASIAHLYWANTIAEWVLVAGSVWALAHFGHYALIPQVVGIIIGLHFFVLGRLLSESRYYLLATAMISAVLASLLIPGGGIRNAIACAGIGLPMWITALIILSQDWSYNLRHE